MHEFSQIFKSKEMNSLNLNVVEGEKEADGE